MYDFLQTKGVRILLLYYIFDIHKALEKTLPNQMFKFERIGILELKSDVDWWGKLVVCRTKIIRVAVQCSEANSP